MVMGTADSSADGDVSGIAGAALRSKEGASFRAMALPGAKAWTFSKSSAG